MNELAQLEAFLTRIFRNAIISALQSLPLTLPADPAALIPEEASAPAAEEKPKRTRKPKEPAPAPFLSPVPQGQELPANVPTAAQSVAPAEQAIAQTVADPLADLPKAAEPTAEPVPDADRKNVSASLITVAKKPELGPSKAFEVLSKYGAKEVKDLPASSYTNVVNDCAKLLGIAYVEALKLDPTKG